jgi:hypothetical protein
MDSLAVLAAISRRFTTRHFRGIHLYLVGSLLGAYTGVRAESQMVFKVLARGNPRVTASLGHHPLRREKELVMVKSRVSLAAACIWLLSMQHGSAQSVTGAGIGPVIGVGQGQGQGTPQGNLTASARFDDDGVPTGTVRIRLPGFAQATVDVNCLHIDGNIAIVGGPIRAGTSFDPALNFLYLIIEDNGPSVQGEPVDRVLAFATNFDACDATDIFLFLFRLINPDPMSHGNYAVSEEI